MALVLTLTGCTGAEPGAPAGFAPARDRPAASEILFQNRSGDVLSLAAFRGQVVVLNLWATWCTPCVQEMPALERLQARVDPSWIAVVAVSVDRDPEKTDGFFRKHNLKNLQLSGFMDPSGAVMRDLRIRSLPTTVLVDPEGRELGRVEGPLDWDSPETVRWLESLYE
ncbi:MAG: TlpA family protein disulfide reductase [Pseudomonadota bacterium]|nr:TlpA family protein disulfide reductase [Pseudomonadota bacterium]